jgi:hypothetical protein
VDRRDFLIVGASAASAFLLAIGGCAAGRNEPIGIPAHKAAITLFTGSASGQFDTFLRSKGLNWDPDHVFQIENGTVHVSGEEYGYMITKESYGNYYLRAEFKWGEGTYGKRAGRARDSGILYNIQGEQKVWPRSIEFQILEGGTGDFWITDGAALTAASGERVVGPAGTALLIDHLGKGPTEDDAGVRDLKGDMELPHGQWNTLQLIVRGDRVQQYVNGKLANEGTNPFPSEGKILLQSEGAEVFFRNVKLYPLE